ncbi:unnamed protein product [Effrenium voratum]|nr:unnamed protein product [Effrenium voratum]CAJ1412549.1 unnamed protein product [Effrenium voratum]
MAEATARAVAEPLQPVLDLLEREFAGLRAELVREVKGAARTAPNLAVHGVRSEHEALPFVCSESSDGSHIDMRGGTTSDSEWLLRRHKSFTSAKILAKLGEEEEIQAVRRLSRGTAKVRPWSEVMEEAKEEVQQALRSVAKSEASTGKEANHSEESGHRIEPPEGDPTPMLNGSQLSPGERVSPSRSSRGASMTEKAFSLHRGGSMTSLDLKQTSWIQRKLMGLVGAMWFESLSMILLMANAVLIGVQTDYMAINNSSSVPFGLRITDLLFCVFFSIELILRLVCFGRRFFTMNGCAWNVMDMLLVSAHMTEEILLLIAEAEGGRLANTNPDVMRIIRVLRAIKVVRLVGAVRFAQDLQLLINCLFRSLKQFLWSALLLLLAIYVVAVYITQAATAYRLESNEGTHKANMLRWWGSMPQSVLSLFQGVTGGVDWHQISDPLVDGISPWFGLLFIVFMAFCILALLNVITGTFVETMSQQAKELQLRNRIYQARRLFREIDRDGSGFISPDEILDHTETPAVLEFFETIDIDPSEAKGLLEVIDIDGNGKINFEEFLEGSLRLNGAAKSSDLIMLAREMKRFHASQLKELDSVKAMITRRPSTCSTAQGTVV